MEQLKQMLEQLIQSGRMPPGLIEQITEAQNDPAKLAQLVKQLSAHLGPMAQDTLNIGDYYHEGNGSLFELRWPLQPGNPLVVGGIPFTELDRKTQFFTLFAEWSRREADGLLAMSGGDLDRAQEIFLECGERADQIDVAELRARSYENLARVAERRSDQKSAIKWLDKATQARMAA